MDNFYYDRKHCRFCEIISFYDFVKSLNFNYPVSCIEYIIGAEKFKFCEGMYLVNNKKCITQEEFATEYLKAVKYVTAQTTDDTFVDEKNILYGIGADQNWGQKFFLTLKKDRTVINKTIIPDKANVNKVSKVYERPEHFYNIDDDYLAVWLVSKEEWEDLHTCECCGAKF